MKKLFKIFLSTLLAFSLTVVSEHTHDEDCGYNPETETGCIYDVDLTGLGIQGPGEEDPSN